MSKSHIACERVTSHMEKSVRKAKLNVCGMTELYRWPNSLNLD